MEWIKKHLAKAKKGHKSLEWAVISAWRKIAKLRIIKTGAPEPANLIPKDRAAIEYLVKEKTLTEERIQKNIRQKQKLDEQIVAVERSTKVSIKQFCVLHNYLRQKYRWYYRWHMFKYSSQVHYGVLALFVMGAFSIGFSVLTAYPNFSQASNPQGTVNGVASEPNTGGSLYFNDQAYNANVYIDDYTRQMSGYAWSSDLGWIDFGSGTDNPSGPVTVSATGALSGIARELNSGKNLTFTPATYGSNVSIASNGNFSGYAWSDDVGWVNFTGVSSPNYTPDLLPPNNPSAITAYNSSAQTTQITSSNYYNYSNPYFSWVASTDNATGVTPSGVAGYYVYFGPNASANPTVTSGLIGSGGAVDYTASTNATVTTAPTLPSTNYLIFEAEDNAGNISSNTTAFTYNYASVPGAPTIGTATVGVGSASVSFTTPGNNGGALITGYTVTSTPGSYTGTGTSSPITVSGLSIGVNYTFTVHATNSIGNSAESAASNQIILLTVPDAPTIGTATPGSSQASVAFSTPSNTGGTTITGYTVTSTPGSYTGTGTSSPISVTGLTNGTSYTFTVHATNSVGSGAESASSNAIIPLAIPTISATTTSDTKINVIVNPGTDPSGTTFAVAISSNGGSTWSYVKQSNGSIQGSADWETYTTWGSASGTNATGLNVGTAYLFKVEARGTDNIATAFSGTASATTTNPTIQLGTTSSSGSISVPSVSIPVTLSDAINQTATVNYSATGGTGVNGTDYTLTSGTATITAGQTAVNINLTINNNHLVGSNKTVVVTLTGPSNSVLGTNATYTYTIVNDNVGPTGSFIINSGGAKTNSRSVTLKVTDTSATQAEFSFESNLADASYQAIASSYSETLADSDGSQTVYLRLKDQYDNTSPIYSESITLDRVAPAAPTNVTAQAGQKAISLAWTNPTASDLSEINIYRSTTSNFTPSSSSLLTTIKSATTQTYLDSTVTDNQNYYYELTALDDVSNESVASSQVSGKPDSDAPSTPGSATVAPVVNTINGIEYASTRSVTLNWTPATDTNSGLADYFVTIGTVSGGTNILNAQANATTTLAYQFTSDGTYYIRIMAKDNMGNSSAYSAEQTLVVDTISPSDPVNPLMYDASNRSANIYAVALSFKSSTDATAGIKGYIVSRNGTPIVGASGITDGVVSDPKSGNSFYLDVLTSGAQATYTVQAVDNALNKSTVGTFHLANTSLAKLLAQTSGSTSISLPQQVVGQGALTISGIKVVASSVVGDTTQATVSWSSSVPSTSQVQYGQSTNYNLKSPLDSGLDSTHTVVLTDLKPGTTYHYMVTSTNQSGGIVSSTDQSFTTNNQTQQESILDTIVKNISTVFVNIWSSVNRVFGLASAANTTTGTINGMSVIDISTPTQPGYAIYWPKSTVSVTVSRVSGSTETAIGSSNQGFFIDFPSVTGNYTYKVGTYAGTTTNNLSGASVISNINITAGTVTETQASVIISFNTDKLAQSQVFYGQGGSLSSQTPLDSSLNQSHTVAIDTLKPGTTYSFKLQTTDSTGQNVIDSSVQTFTTPPAPINQSVLEVIINALQGAFSGLNGWMSS